MSLYSAPTTTHIISKSILRKISFTLSLQKHLPDRQLDSAERLTTFEAFLLGPDA